MADCNIQPSEVRDMTVGEVMAVIWAKTRSQQDNEALYAQMYEELEELERLATVTEES